jgi:hypothetical protein
MKCSRRNPVPVESAATEVLDMLLPLVSLVDNQVLV